MPARDIYHDCVREALVKDGWTITHDPYTIPYGLDRVYVDLGAEKTIAAERSGERIAVEIKGFLGPSELKDFELALGQYVFYRSLLARREPDRKLYLAVPEDAYDLTFRKPITEPPIEDIGLLLLVFDPVEKVILRWKP